MGPLPAALDTAGQLIGQRQGKLHVWYAISAWHLYLMQQWWLHPQRKVQQPGTSCPAGNHSCGCIVSWIGQTPPSCSTNKASRFCLGTQPDYVYKNLDRMCMHKCCTSVVPGCICYKHMLRRNHVQGHEGPRPLQKMSHRPAESQSASDASSLTVALILVRPLQPWM